MKRLAIVGTAETWREAPYDDPSWKIASLNDAYRLGIRRADFWYDLHNPDEWWLVPEGQTFVNAWERPEGKFYPRPHDHLKFFETVKCPAFVYAARQEWPTARTFPREAIERMFGRYMASTPAWMMAHAVLPEDQGGFGLVAGDEIGVWGVHLATEREYVEQRPNFEWLIGRVEAMGITVTLPEDCPVRKTSWLYAFEKRPDYGMGKLRAELGALTKQRDAIVKWILGPKDKPLKTMPVPLWVPEDAKDRLDFFEAAIIEASGRMTVAHLREKGIAA